ncbi:MAG: prolipoprotein diacylglyceryl transferase [Thermoanaerobacteraceae bacterium]|nr:prolipoprotein diacylglyceryl transferase [Thermoanaerobacteraceae bacterium]
MDPIAFEIGPFSVRWYGILMSTSLALGTFLAYWEAMKQKIDPDHVINLVIVAAPLAFIGARVYYVIFRWSYYSKNPSEIPAIWHGGLAIHGALIMGTLAGYFYVKRQGLNFWQMADIVAPSIVLGQAIGRWGNFFNQEAYGYPTNLPWAMYIDGAYRHPTFLYESLWDFGIFLFLLWFRRRKGLRRGEVFLTYAIAYSAGRFVIEGFRTDSLMLGSLRMAQVISVVIIIAAAAVIYYRRKISVDNKYF